MKIKKVNCMVYPSFKSFNRTPGRPKVSGELMDMIEHLRSELMNAAEQEDFNSVTVVELSQRLDQYIVMAQNQMLGR
ncbi:aspartyl-phosphate phosphatase Spo0E family protein [Paenibacillus sp. Marseille-P2973]|uniref:aspartyl-phosphate phosphatase Spo0E family protein n=2 Tax=Paenibacillus TaxID=44249 RepID=UPI001FFC5008|nr:aspartyl-phosphate phosphatase Spo0E family protein [Paenibacillus sp. Marseille-P2973]